MSIKLGDKVVIIAGKDKGKTGKVIKIAKKDDKVLVEKLNIVKKHQKSNSSNPDGGIIEREAYMHISNVMIVDPESKKPTRIKKEINKDGTKSRIAVKSGKKIK